MTNRDKALKKIEKITKEYTWRDYTGHDYWHHKRVVGLCRLIQEKEGGDLYVLEVAGWLHDICRQKELESGTIHYGREALLVIAEIMEAVRLPVSIQKRAIECIQYHEDYNANGNNRKHSLETTILQDADRLDALGCIGIARCFMFNGANGMQMWNPDDRVEIFDPSKPPSKSAITHFDEKLMRLERSISTHTAQLIARRLTRKMRLFLKEFKREWYAFI